MGEEVVEYPGVKEGAPLMTFAVVTGDDGMLAHLKVCDKISREGFKILPV